ncbi:MAG: TadG family pilus assembly protein, partial [Phycisphaerae bacterium]
MKIRPGKKDSKRLVPNGGTGRGPVQRRGVSVVGVAIVTPVLLGFVALAVDVGFMYSVAGETQNAVDAAAVAGAHALAEGADVNARVHTYLDPNYLTGGIPSNLETIEIGTWDAATRSFIVGGATPNAVRVAVTRENAPLYFAPVFGVNTFNVPREAVAIMEPPQECRLWGINNATIHGGSGTDSYDSTVYAYNPAFPDANGDVCSCGDVRLSGTPVFVDGDVYYGQGYQFDTGGNPTATGEIAELDACIDPVLDFGDVEVVNDNDTIGLTDGGVDPLDTSGGTAAADFKINSGDILTLQAGTYYFTSFDIAGNASLTVTGPTTIYVDGDTKIVSGGVVNTTQDTTLLTFISSGLKVDFGGSIEFYGTLFAPNSDVSISGGADFYGTIVGGTLD